MKRLDQSSVTINLKNGSQELTDLVQILKVLGFEEIMYFNNSMLTCDLLKIQEIENRLVNYNPMATDSNSDDTDSMLREEYEVETIKLDSAKAFKAYGGVKV